MREAVAFGVPAPSEVGIEKKVLHWVPEAPGPTAGSETLLSQHPSTIAPSPDLIQNHTAYPMKRAID